jgi:hypothetical protein
MCLDTRRRVASATDPGARGLDSEIHVTFDVTVHTRRYAGTSDQISARLIGEDGTEYEHTTVLGEVWVEGENKLL